MSLVKCPECGAQISDKAYSCPQCGYQNLLEKCITPLRKTWPVVLIQAKQMHVVWTYTAICFVTTLICLTNRQMIDVLAISGSQFELARIHTLLTYSFAHGSIVHWFFNMLFLIPAGIILEPKLRSFKTLSIILAGIIATSICYSLFGSEVPMIGSTGTVCAVLGGIVAVWVLKISHLYLIEKIGTILLVLAEGFLFIGLASTRIEAIGFLAGFLTVFILKRAGQFVIKKPQP